MKLLMVSSLKGKIKCLPGAIPSIEKVETVRGVFIVRHRRRAYQLGDDRVQRLREDPGEEDGGGEELCPLNKHKEGKQKRR